MAAKGNEEPPRSMREIVQKKFLDEVIGSAANWKVLVMDEEATKVISAALTMYDIMERRVTLVEQLNINRQPFPDMDVIYLLSPNIQGVKRISADFESRSKAKYGNVHLVFIDAVSPEVFTEVQNNSLLVSKVKTFKEIYLNFLSVESNVFEFYQRDALTKLYGSLPDPGYPVVLGKRLANLCITLNEHPCIRYQSNSLFAREIATTVHRTVEQFKKSNPEFVCNGEDSNHDRERGQLLILERSFDPVSPLMHEYTYQAMVNDLLNVEDGVISYTITTNKGVEEDKKAILNENDEFWLELRHSHIAKVIESIKTRMDDIIQNNSGAQLAKGNGADLDITTMASAVKKLPEYQQAMSKLGQHVTLAQQCMDEFGRLGLMNLSQVEQTISTGFDEDGKEVKGTKLVQLVSETVRSNAISKDQKVRLLAIFLVTQRNSSSEEFKQLTQAARLNPTELQSLTNFERLLRLPQQAAAAAPGKTGLFQSIFKKTEKHAPTPEGEYADTRHTCQLKILLEQLINNQLPLDKFPTMGPVVSASAGSGVKSVRKFGVNSRWTKSKDNISGGRYIAYIAGGVGFAELRAGYELITQHSKEVIIGSSHVVSPDQYINEVSSLNSTATLNMSAIKAVNRQEAL
eukprot:gene10661-14317_t